MPMSLPFEHLSLHAIISYYSDSPIQFFSMYITCSVQIPSLILGIDDISDTIFRSTENPKILARISMSTRT